MILIDTALWQIMIRHSALKAAESKDGTFYRAALKQE
jgi:hypothetical protein